MLRTPTSLARPLATRSSGTNWAQANQPPGSSTAATPSRHRRCAASVLRLKKVL
jgi:hypothetical protein